MKVDFMIIGAMKCGTSSLSKILMKHPEVSFCKKKEPHYFSKSKNWKTNLKYYESLFKEEEGKIYGEASTTYTFYPQFNLEIWKDIYEYNANMKFIYIVRNPVDRIISQYVHMVQRGFINVAIEEAIISLPAFINLGRYYTQIKPFIEQFGRKNILIIDFDELIHYKEKVLQSIAGFLNIEANYFEHIENFHSNKSIGGHIIHHRYDYILKYYIKYFRWAVPKLVKNILWKKIQKKNLSKFKEKPVLSNIHRQIIINLTMLDIIELEKVSGMNLDKWKII